MAHTVQMPRRLLHAAALAFTAWWLIATSAPRGPARDCFTGIGDPTRLRVKIGAEEAPPDGGSPLASCGGLDGLGPAAALTFDLRHAARPDVASNGCFGYETTAITGATDVTLDTASTGRIALQQQLTTGLGNFTSSKRVSCRGSWWITLRPQAAPPQGQLISPLNAGVGQRWLVERGMVIAQAQFCDGAFTDAGEIQCLDTFVVDGIVEEPAP